MAQQYRHVPSGARGPSPCEGPCCSLCLWYGPLNRDRRLARYFPQNYMHQSGFVISREQFRRDWPKWTRPPGKMISGSKPRIVITGVNVRTKRGWEWIEAVAEQFQRYGGFNADLPRNWRPNPCRGYSYTTAYAKAVKQGKIKEQH